MIPKPQPCPCGGRWRQQSGADSAGNRRFTCTGCKTTTKADANGNTLKSRLVLPDCPSCGKPEWKTSCSIGGRQYRTCRSCGYKGITSRETGEILEKQAPGTKLGSERAAKMAEKRWQRKVMPCPSCNATIWHVRASENGRQYRQCRVCGHKGITDLYTGEMLERKQSGFGGLSREKRAQMTEKMKSTKRNKPKLPDKPLKHPDEPKKRLPSIGSVMGPIAKMPTIKVGSSAWSRIDDLKLRRESVSDDPLFA